MEKDLSCSDIPVGGGVQSGSVGGGSSSDSINKSDIPMSGGQGQPVMQNTTDKNMAD